MAGKYILGVIFAALLCYAAVCDIKTLIIPDKAFICVLFLGGARLITGGLSPPDAISGMIVCGVPFLISALFSDGVGSGGDIKLFAASGFFLGFANGFRALAAGLFLFLVFFAVKRPGNNAGGKSRVLFGPFIAAGSIISYLTGVIIS